ncbi:hypothetical protein B0H14DRAFT_3455216 [Mycena olivaceomarginata]|nr:hypothetical protein B0H14DRAFT_3455216 [Mycena olivaceomarginata]
MAQKIDFLPPALLGCQAAPRCSHGWHFDVCGSKKVMVPVNPPFTVSLRLSGHEHKVRRLNHSGSSIPNIQICSEELEHLVLVVSVQPLCGEPAREIADRTARFEAFNPTLPWKIFEGLQGGLGSVGGTFTGCQLLEVDL